MLAVEAVSLSAAALDGATAVGDSFAPSISADGQRVVFASDASTLVPNDDNGVRDVFLYDRGTGRVELLSVTADGLMSADRGGVEPKISAGGRYVAFLSDAANLVASPPVNNFFQGQPDVYVRDLLTDRTVMISSFFDNSRDSDSAVSNIDIVDTADGGAMISWQTQSANMVAGDDNGVSDVFVRKLNPDGSLQPTRLVSNRPDGVIGDGPSFNASLTPGGRFVVFQSQADNLVPQDVSNLEDIFVRDLVDNTIDLVTVDSAEINQVNGHVLMSRDGAISDDGRYVVFWSAANNLVPQNTAFQTNAFIRDRVEGTTRLLSINRDGTRGSHGVNAMITPDGRYAAFAGASNDTASDVIDTNGVLDIFLAEITPDAITTRMASANADGGNGGNAAVFGFPQISDDGRYVAFASEATDLVAGLTDGNQGQQDAARRRDVFLRDMQDNVTQAVSRVNGATGDSGSYTPAMSGNGQFIAFETVASDLVAADNNRRQDILLWDRIAGISELASVRTSLLPGRVPAGGALLHASRDGRYVVFTSNRGDLITPDVPEIGGGVVTFLYVHDRQTGETQLASIRSDGTGQSGFGGGLFPSASISDDGRFVAFASNFNDLDGGIAGTNGGVYVRDLELGVTTMISRNAQTGAPANDFHGDMKVVISPDGRWVAFSSISTNLISGVTVPNDQPNLYLFDRQTGDLRLVTINFAGTASASPPTNSTDLQPVFSADSSRMAFVSRGADLIAGVVDMNDAVDVFAMDLTGPNALQLHLVSESEIAGTTGDAESGGQGGQHAPTLSDDGRYVAFGSLADNLVSDATPAALQIFRRDLMTGATELVSWNNDETSGIVGGAAITPQISGDGDRVVFQARTASLSPLASAVAEQVYVRHMTAGETELVSINPAGDAAGDLNSRFLDGVFPTDFAKISPNGRFVAFLSQATNLIDGFVDGTPGGSQSDIFVRDLTNGRTVLATNNFSGTASADRGAGAFFVTDDGTVVFESIAHDLVLGDRHTPLFNTGVNDVFAYEFRGAGQIRGTVFEDTSGDGTQDQDEAGLPYWTVYVDANSNNHFDPGEETVITDRTGEYAFTGLPAGEYAVRVVVDTGFVQTSPLDPPRYMVMLPDDEAVVNDRDFGAQLAPIDLAVDSVTSPASAEVGRTVSITWRVRNAAAGAVMGDWQDAVYLSADDALDASDTLLASVPHTGGLPALGTYFAQIDVDLPPLPAGEYHVLVRTDRRRQVAGEQNRDNNLAASVEPIALSIPALTLGAAAVDGFTAANQNRYYQVTVAAGQSLLLNLDSAAADGGVELYARFGELPTPHAFDFAERNAAPDQTLVIPVTQAGVYFVLARSKFGAAAASAFDLTASAPGFGVQSVEPAVGGNAGPVTLAIQGTNLTATTTAVLKSGATMIAAAAIDFRDPSRLFATFDLTGQTEGAFDVQLTDGDQTSTLPGAFTVTQSGEAPGLVFLDTPAVVRTNRDARIAVEWVNLSNIDLPAPQIRITADGALLRLENQPQFAGVLEFLGASDSGPADVIRPGQRVRRAIVIHNTEPVTPLITFTLEIIDVASLHAPSEGSAGAERKQKDWGFASSASPSNSPEPPRRTWNSVPPDPVLQAGAFDPNEIIGPAGVGQERFLNGVQTLPYTIFFENDPEIATAPAQEVTISHQLDADLDPATFELDDFGFGSLVVDVPAGVQAFERRLTYQNQDGSPLLVDAVASFNAETGMVTWTLRSVDPVTGELPEGVFDGFLPVNDDTGRGEGFVSFRVRSKNDTATGAAIDAIASIVFDTNAAISTNTHTNTIDRDSASSQVAALPANTADPNIPVMWSGDDGAGSGIASFDIFVSIDGGAFQLWQDDTTATSAVYPGAVGHTYAFFSVSTDNVGWVEEAPAAADAQVAVGLLTWTNGDDAADITGDGPVNLVDLLALVQFLREQGADTGFDVVLPAPTAEFGPPPYVDPNGDGRANVADLLHVIQVLRGASGEGEGEADDANPLDAALFQIASDIATRRRGRRW